MRSVPSVVSARGADATPRARTKLSTAMPIEQTSDRGANQAQQNAAASTTPARAAPYASTFFEAVAFKSGVGAVLQHKLGRKYKGVRTSVPTAAATFRLDTSQDAQLASAQVTIVASADCTADVEVYG